MEYQGFYIEDQKGMFGIYFHNEFIIRAETIKDALMYVDFYERCVFITENNSK